MGIPHLFYFGPWDVPGHYLHDTTGRTLWPDNNRIGPWRMGELDGGLQPNAEKGYRRVAADEPEGVALLHQKDGWTALAFWDRSVDTRMACCSVYIADKTLTFDEMVAFAKANFKARWDKMKFQVRLAEQPREGA